MLWWVLLSCAHSFQIYTRRVPNGEERAWGHVGGVGGAGINLFGKSFAENGYKWTESLCRADSDGDYFTNGEELGDPDCNWEEGGVALCPAANSDPGDPSSQPAGPLVGGCVQTGDLATQWGPVPPEGLVCEHIVVGAGAAGMVASARLGEESNGVCVIARERPETTASAASSGTFFLPLVQSELPVQTSPLEYFEEERRAAFLDVVSNAQAFAEATTGLLFRPSGAFTYSGENGTRVMVPSVSKDQCAYANMTEWLLSFERENVQYFRGWVQEWGPSSKEGRTVDGRRFRALKSVVIAAGGYGGSGSKEWPWKGAIADNDGLNLRVAEALNQKTSGLSEAWFVERGRLSHNIYWFLWQENAAVLAPDGTELEGYNPLAAYDARGRARVAAGNPENVSLVYANTTLPCRTGGVQLPSVQPLQTKDRVCGKSEGWWYTFPSSCFYCSSVQGCGQGLDENQSAVGEFLDLWVIDSNGGPVVGTCNEFTAAEGVYAVGNAAPPMLGHAYLAPGSTLGNALVSAWRAAECILEKEAVLSEPEPSPLPYWMRLHGGGMLFVWGTIFTLGYVNPKQRAHPWLMGLVTVTNLVLVLLVLVKGDLFLGTARAHPWFGLVVTSLSVAQPFWWWGCNSAVGHRWAGRVLVVFVVLAVVSGSIWISKRDKSLVFLLFLGLTIGWSLKMHLIERILLGNRLKLK